SFFARQRPAAVATRIVWSSAFRRPGAPSSPVNAYARAPPSKGGTPNLTDTFNRAPHARLAGHRNGFWLAWLAINVARNHETAAESQMPDLQKRGGLVCRFLWAILLAPLQTHRPRQMVQSGTLHQRTAAARASRKN